MTCKELASTLLKVNGVAGVAGLTGTADVTGLPG
jgi:hypothetical protein